MKIKMYLYPSYVNLGSAKSFSLQLFTLLKERGVELEADYWDGTLETIPTEGAPVIVRSSRMKKCSVDDLAQKCANLGHFLFYDDKVILVDGRSYGGEILIDEANRFIDRVATYEYEAKRELRLQMEKKALRKLKHPSQKKRNR